MPEYKAKTSKILGINKGATVLLAGADIDVLFSYLLSCVVEGIEGIVKAASKALAKCDEKYVEKKDGKPVPILDSDGKPTGEDKIRPEDRDEWETEREKILDKVKGFTCPAVKMSDLRHAQNEDGVKIPGWIVHSLRPIMVVNDADKKKAGVEKPPEKPKTKPVGRAAQVKAAKAAKAKAEKEAEEE